ncbi:MAG: ABC transporter substrate-binding protein [Actinomycetota bacterium]
MTKRFPALIALMFWLLLGAAACSSDDGDDSSTPTTAADISDAETAAAPDESGLTVQRGGEVSIGIVAESSGWYPPSAETAFSAGFLVMDALYDRWFHLTGTGEIVPVLAEERATPNDDASEWTVKIREGVKFHDGTDLNAQAAVDMVVQWSEGPFAASSPIDRAEVVDEFTVRYFLNEPDPAFENTLAGTASGAAFSPTAGRAFGPEDSVENPIGTGPFMFESWTRDSELVLVRNPNYWRSAPDGGTLPYLDRVRFRVLTDGDARRASFAAGDLDLITQGGPDGGQALIDDGAVPYEYIGNGTGVNIYNVFEPPFDDVRIRRAAAHALNPDSLVALTPSNLSGINVVRTQYFSSTSRWYDEAAGEGYATYDLAEAQRLADEYINDPDRSDGKAVGEPVSFIYDCNTDPVNLDRAQLFQQEWGDIGFEVEIETTEQSSYITKIVGTNSEPLFAGEFQIGCWADGNEQDPLQIFRNRYGEDQVLNWTNLVTPEITEQINILRNNLDFDVRKAATAEISRITAELMPLHWWASGSNLVLTKPMVRGLENYTYPDGGAGERMPSGRIWWHEVWIDDAEPLTDIPTDFIAIPDVPEPTTTTTAPPAPAVPTNPDVEALLPPPPAGLTAAGNDAPLTELCPGISFLDTIEPISATFQQYQADPTVGPFVAINIYELAEGEADAIIARYDQAVVDCAEFSTVLESTGAALELGYVERDFGSFGDETRGYGTAGTADGFPIDSDVVLIKTGNNLAVVTSLHVLSPADGTVVGFAETAGEILASLG